LTTELLALSGAGTILLALSFFYFPWQSFVVDQTRQRLFECRDRWFDFSQSLTSANDKAAAAAIRVELNYMIRMLHDFTVPVLAYCILLHAVLGDASEHSENELDRLITSFDSAPVRDEARKVTAAAIVQITFCMWRRSLLALILTPFVIIGFALLSTTMSGAKSLGVSLEKSVANLAVRENRQLVPKC
jgi:hypothetical protein